MGSYLSFYAKAKDSDKYVELFAERTSTLTGLNNVFHSAPWYDLEKPEYRKLTKSEVEEAISEVDYDISQLHQRLRIILTLRQGDLFDSVTEITEIEESIQENLILKGKLILLSEMVDTEFNGLEGIYLQYA